MSTLPLEGRPGDRLTPKLRRIRRAAPIALFKSLLTAATHGWQGGGLTIQLPEGDDFVIPRAGEGPDAVFKVNDIGFMRRVMAAGDIGFAEGYIAGEWDTPDLAALLSVLAANFFRLKRLSVGSPLVRLSNRVMHHFRRNTPEQAKRNIYAHYDLGNDFYQAWLDPSMTYSSALWAQPDQTLEAAQREKYAALARAIDLQPGQHVLEIGCGWGGFAEYAATEVGAEVTGITISKAQYDFATARLARAGVADRARVVMQDYRDVRGQFDRIASIEMFEAVGEAYWPGYFAQVHDRLKPGGKAGLQIITIRDAAFEHYRTRIDFIRKYIFPGGMLPSETRLKEETDRAGLEWAGINRFGLDYALTLKLWDERFEAVWPHLKPHGFDEAFRRLWRFYLAYCEAGFRTKQTDVVQLVLQRR
jgi:cyclopropane-fatty-acyl-phospholipid synthase